MYMVEKHLLKNCTPNQQFVRKLGISFTFHIIWAATTIVVLVISKHSKCEVFFIVNNNDFVVDKMNSP